MTHHKDHRPVTQHRLESKMELDFNAEILNSEIIADNIKVLNKHLRTEKEIFLSVNIRSLNANYNKLLVFINNLKIKPCIIICTETWNLEHKEIFNIPNYKMFYNDSKINKADGVVVYISDDINEDTEIVQLNKLKIINSKITFSNNKKLLLSAVYRSHDIHKTEFLLNIKNLLQLNKKFKNNLIVGDFNLDLLSQEIIDQEFLQTLLTNGYCPGFSSITRPSDINNNNGTCIDNFFIKLDKIKYKTYLLSTPFNDHFPLMMSLNKIKKNQKQPMKKWTIGNVANNTVNWSEINNITDPNLAVNELIKKIKMCITETSIKRNKNNRMKPRNSWISRAIIVSCKNKEKLYNIWKNDPTNITKKEEYKKYVKILNRIINQAKEDFDKKQIQQSNGNSKKLWGIINDKLGKNKNKTDINYIIDDNNKKIKDSKIIAEKMNKFFCEVGKQLSNNIKTPDNANIKLPPMNNKSIYINPTNKNEIIEIIQDLKLKQGGSDDINTQVLKALSTQICDPLVHIFNKSIESGIWPEALKIAQITPIHKAKEKYLPTNYRPISLISNIAKIFEKLIHKRILNFFDNCNLLSNKQYGFRKNKSTKDALFHITNLIYNELDNSNPIAITFLDLAKAFDTVDHNILLDKLYNYGVRGNAHKLIKSYLSNRKQRVKVNNQFSDYETIEMGVPQGTILGPLLFIIYINDMLNEMPENSILSYADDTAIITTGKDWKEIEYKMNKFLYEIAKWLALNKLSLNTDKTVYMEFGNNCNSTPKNLNININGIKINRVDNTRYLGVIFDSNMKWDVHINTIYRKTKYLTFTFYNLAKIMSTDNLRMLYYALFHSIATYGILAWGGAYSGRLICLQNLQNKLLKIVNKNKFIHEKNPLNIEQTFSHESLQYHYNILRKKYTESNQITRNKSIQIPKRLRNISIKNSYIRAITYYNRLPIHLKTLKNKYSIKTKIKQWIKEY